MERKYTYIKKHIITQMFLQKGKLHYNFNQVCKKIIQKNYKQGVQHFLIRQS